MITQGREIQSDIFKAASCEWLITNGIGGYASSSVPCVNTRRYHGILVAAMRPPVERLVLVSRLEETIIIDGREIALSTCIHANEIKNPNGYLYIERFEREPIPAWYYQIQDVMLIKTINMVYGHNTTLISYKALSNGHSVSLKIRPHMLFRDFHGNMYESSAFNLQAAVNDKSAVVKPFSNAPKLFMRWDIGTFVNDARWHKDIFLQKEKERGLNEREDDFSCGYVKIDNLSGSASILFSDEPIQSFNPINLRKSEEQRLEAVASSLNSSDPLLKKLLLAADQFIVERKSTKSRTIIAGYPWFSDWGRDSLISLPGLTLVTGRYNDARSILKTFASTIQNGLVANCFADQGTDAAYNSVDASLWFFIAAYKFVEYTDDYAFIKENLFEGMNQIIDSFLDGTSYNIKADESDGLLAAGSDSVQITWMDSKIGLLVVTPRDGKAVEINALWYNALRIYAMLQDKFGGNSRETLAYARKTKQSFKKAFYDYKNGCLYDCIRPNGSIDKAFRCNQIFAVSLPFSILEPPEERAVVNAVFERLYTSYGLRSLAPCDKHYEGVYAGGQKERDKAYHQGCVWGYLIGPFISAYLKVNSSIEAQLRASIMIEPLRNHLNHEGCLGSISEIFEGNAPHRPKGCFAQAWSVAELLRCYVEDIKGQKPEIII